MSRATVDDACYVVPPWLRLKMNSAYQSTPSHVEVFAVAGCCRPARWMHRQAAGACKIPWARTSASMAFVAKICRERRQSKECKGRAKRPSSHTAL